MATSVGMRSMLDAPKNPTTPFVFLRRLPTGEAAGVRLKVRGWLDGLRDREPPFEALGLR